MNDEKSFAAVVVIPQYKRSRTVTGHLSLNTFLGLEGGGGSPTILYSSKPTHDIIQIRFQLNKI